MIREKDVLLEEVDLGVILRAMRDKLNVSYARIASDLGGFDVRTIYRWRDEGKSKYLNEKKYEPLFDIFGDYCAKRKLDVRTAWTLIMPSLEAYETKNDIETVICRVLEWKYAGQEGEIDLSVMTETVAEMPFIEHCVAEKNSIRHICVTFQGGWMWLKSVEVLDMVKELDSAGVTFSIIINDESEILKLAKAMSAPDKRQFYLGFNDGIRQWKKWQAFLQHCEVRVASYPLLRRMMLVEYKDGRAKCLLRHYAYDYRQDWDAGRILIDDADPYLEIYRREFRFLWDTAHSEDELRLILSNHEVLEPGIYALYYASNRLDPETGEPRLVNCRLEIAADNEVHLFVNVSAEIRAVLSGNRGEYAYHGMAKVTKTNVFMPLFDDKGIEMVTLSVKRSLYESGSHTGILTGVSPGGHPLATKFVCIEQSLLASIDLQQALDPLRHTTAMLVDEPWGRS